MRIYLESGEHIAVVVPAHTGSTAAVSIETEFGSKVASLSTESGLIGESQEFIARRRDVARVNEDKLVLWAHIVSQHCTMLTPKISLKELIEIHDHEHDGPATIRNHPREARHFSMSKIGKVLSEHEPEDDEPYEGSFCEAADNEGARIAASSRSEE